MPKRLITVVRGDLSPGYQIAQSCHAVADYAYENPYQFKQWREGGNYMISLSVESSCKLAELCLSLTLLGVQHSFFYEDDINEHTALCFVEDERTKELTKNLKLAGSQSGTKNKQYGLIKK